MSPPVHARPRARAENNATVKLNIFIAASEFGGLNRLRSARILRADQLPQASRWQVNKHRTGGGFLRRVSVCHPSGAEGASWNAIASITFRAPGSVGRLCNRGVGVSA